MSHKVYIINERTEGKGRVALITCPGCKSEHPFKLDVPQENGAMWSFNEDLDNPTFSPSMLVWAENPDIRCHSFVTNGQIQFLGDCYHELKNTTVELPVCSWYQE